MGASTALVCLGTVLAACGDGGGGGGDGGYVAVEAPAKSPTVVAPTGHVSLAPLVPPAGSSPPKGAPQQGSSGPGGSGSLSASNGTATNGTPGGGNGNTSMPWSGSGNSGRTTGGSGSPSASPPPTAPGSTTGTGPAGPAVLSVGDPTREATDKRWCEKVTVSFRNTGETAVRSGTVTLGTHIIGLLGIDWATIESTRDLPAPIAAEASSTKTWTVCVDAWRVPLGMHIETRDVSVQWK